MHVTDERYREVACPHEPCLAREGAPCIVGNGLALSLRAHHHARIQKWQERNPEKVAERPERSLRGMLYDLKARFRTQAAEAERRAHQGDRSAASYRYAGQADAYRRVANELEHLLSRSDIEG